MGSIEIAPATDLVRQYQGYNTGKWVYTAWQYIPSTMVGQTYFILMNGYASSLSPVVLGNLLGELMAGKKGDISVGELGIPESRYGRVLPCGSYGRWRE